MTDGLAQIQEKSRLTYRYWPIWLVLRVREIEQHLETGGERGLLGPPTTQMLLRQYDLWNGKSDDVASPPEVEIPVGSELMFAAHETDNGTILSATATHIEETWRLDLMRAPTEHAHVLAKAAQAFNQMRYDHDPNAALNAARRWAALHGARALGWRVVRREEAGDKGDVAWADPGMGFPTGSIEDDDKRTPATSPSTEKKRWRRGGQRKPTYRGFGGG